MSRVFSNSQTGANETTIRTPANAVYNTLSKGTVSCWIFVTTLPSGSAVSVFVVKDPTSSYTTNLLLFQSAGSTFLEGAIKDSLSNIGVSDSQQAIPANQWVHVVMTFDFTGDKKVHLFINGTEVTYSTQTAVVSSTPATDSGDGWWFGNDSFDEGLTGNLAEVAIWNTVLTSGQISSLHSSTSGAAGIQSANLVGYWHLCGQVSPEPDVTANGDSGVLHGSPLPTRGADSPGFSCDPSPSHSIDSDILVQISKNHNIDGYINQSGFVSHSIDAYIVLTPRNISEVQTTFISGPPTANQSITVSPPGVQVGDVVVVFTNWALFPLITEGPISLGIVPTISDDAGNDYDDVIPVEFVQLQSLGIGVAQQAQLCVVKSLNNTGGLNVSASWSIAGASVVIFPTIYVKVVRNVDPNIPVQSISSTIANPLDSFHPIPQVISTGPNTATMDLTFAVSCCTYGEAIGDPLPVPGPGWTFLGKTVQGIGFNAGVAAFQPGILKGTKVTSTFVPQFPTPASPNAFAIWLDQMILLNPTLGGSSHQIDAYIAFIREGFIKEETQLIPPITNPNSFVKTAVNLAQPTLGFVNTAVNLRSVQEDFLNTAVNLAKKTITTYLKTAVTLMKGASPSHNIDALISAPAISFVQTAVTLVQKLQATGCQGSHPDTSFVKAEVWLVAPGNNSKQAPGTGLALADDWLSQQDALSAYSIVGRFVLAGIPLIVTGFTSGVTSFQTRTRQWLRLVDFEPGGVVIQTTTTKRQLPNGQIITTATQVKQIQDTTITTVTTTYSTSNRISTKITEVTRGGMTVTREQDTVTTNGVRKTTEKKTVTSEPPFKDNVQPIKVTTLDGIQHYQFFGAPNQHWAGGDAEGTTETETAVQIVPSSLDGLTISPVTGQPILARITDSTVTSPTGEILQTHTEEIGINDVGTTQTDTASSFNGIQTTTTKTVTRPDGSQEITTTVTNNITGDSVETDTNTTTDENGLTTVTTTVTETKTFQDPVSGNLRTTVNQTVTIAGPNGTTVDTTTETRNNFEDDLLEAKIKVYLVQEFTINCVIDRFSKEALEETAVDHQKNFAIAELIGQQLGNMNLSWVLRNNLINQFNQALNCIDPVQLQALGKTYEVVFASSASSFRAKYIPGTQPAIFELQMVVQARSDLITGLRGF